MSKLAKPLRPLPLPIILIATANVPRHHQNKIAVPTEPRPQAHPVRAGAWIPRHHPRRP